MELPDMSEVIQRFPDISNARLSGQENPFSSLPALNVEVLEC